MDGTRGAGPEGHRRAGRPDQTRCPERATTVNNQEAKTQLSQLLVRVEQGEEIVIARAGTAVARLLPVQPPAARRFGTMDFSVPEDFDAPLPEQELAAWE